MKHKLLAMAVACACTTAHASVVYNWVEIEPNADAGVISGRLVLNDTAWLTGHIVVEPRAFYSRRPLSAEQAGIESYDFNATLPGYPSYARGYHWTGPGYGPCAQMIERDAQNCADFGFAAEDQVIGGPFGYAWDITVSGGTLRGSLFLTASTDAGWDWRDFAMDPRPEDPISAPCIARDVCSDVGFWSLDLSTIPVDEPGTLALAGLGLLGLAVARRRPCR